MKFFSPDRIAKIFFVFSVALLGFCYGYGSRSFGWFPQDQLETAWKQAETLLGNPHYFRDRVYGWSGVRIHRPQEIFPGPTLLTGRLMTESGPSVAQIISREGEVLHRWQVSFKHLFPAPPESRTRYPPDQSNIHGIHLYPNGDLLFNLAYVGTARIDACGRPRWTLPVGSHHAISPGQDRTLWVPGGRWHSAPEDSLIPGLREPIYRDRLLRISPDGQLLEEIDIVQVLAQNKLLRHISKGSSTPLKKPPTGDITHLNDIDPLPPSLSSSYPLFEAGDLLLSLRHLDLVLVMDPATQKVKWHTSHPFIQQHDPDWIGEGWIGVLDNNRDGTQRGRLAGGSRIVALQPHTDSTQIWFPTQRSAPFYTEAMGKWELLPNKNMLLTEAAAGRVVEVNPAGETVWEWVAPSRDPSQVPEITIGTRLPLAPQTIRSWECSP